MQPPTAREKGVVAAPVQRVHGVTMQARRDQLAIEEPLEIRLRFGPLDDRRSRNIAVTMRTPGADAELALGYLFSEGIIRAKEHVLGVAQEGRDCPRQQKQNVVTVDLQPHVTFDATRLERNFYTTSSCGVCGKTSIAALSTNGCPALPPAYPLVEPEVIHRLPVTLRTAQAVFDQTGGLHAAALFDPDGRLRLLREDVGRHNAVDKLVGACLQHGWLPRAEQLLLVSGRASFELVQKALMAGIPLLAAVGAPSSLAVELAEAYGMTLLGFVRNERFNVYAGDTRIRQSATVPASRRTEPQRATRSDKLT